VANFSVKEKDEASPTRGARWDQQNAFILRFARDEGFFVPSRPALVSQP
jgi:hypothetical protein